MNKKLTKKWFYLFAFVILCVSCIPKTPENTAKTYLEPVLQEDLRVITDGIDTTAVLENPYFEIVEFTKFNEGEYNYIAVVDFYFLKDIRQKVFRKYRFHYIRKWELYYNEYQSF